LRLWQVKAYTDRQRFPTAEEIRDHATNEQPVCAHFIPNLFHNSEDGWSVDELVFLAALTIWYGEREQRDDRRPTIGHLHWRPVDGDGPAQHIFFTEPLRGIPRKSGTRNASCIRQSQLNGRTMISLRSDLRRHLGACRRKLL
jgi:hypothetical protein